MTLTCLRCGWNHWPSTNPVELDAWRCSCTPAQTLPDIDGYLDPPTPEDPTPSLVGLTPDGAVPAPSGVAHLDGWDDWLRPTAMPAVLAFAAAPVLAVGLVVWFIARQFGAT